MITDARDCADRICARVGYSGSFVEDELCDLQRGIRRKMYDRLCAGFDRLGGIGDVTGSELYEMVNELWPGGWVDVTETVVYLAFAGLLMAVLGSAAVSVPGRCACCACVFRVFCATRLLCVVFYAHNCVKYLRHETHEMHC